MSVSRYLELLWPWQPSLLVIVIFGLAGMSYFRGSQIKSAGFWHQVSFWLGLLLSYIVLHTKFDYYAEYMFFMHRLQHLILHHLGPFLISLSAPWSTMLRGLGEKPAALLLKFLQHKSLIWIYNLLQQPVIAIVLFVGLIAFWLIPEIHFYAMLNASWYEIMNWSMFVDGLLFWWLILNPVNQSQGARISYQNRFFMLAAIMPFQILIGAYITFSKTIIYDIYSICGRAWPMSPMTDQIIGGIITWIPASMMSVLGAIVVIRFMFKNKPASITNPSSKKWASPVI